MIPELGLLTLIIALAFASLMAVSPIIKPNQSVSGIAHGQTLFVALSYLCLTISFMQNDFSVLYVAKNSSQQLPLWYKWCAVWGSHEGSMLLWLLILSAWTSGVALSRRLDDRLKQTTLLVLGFVSLGFFLFVLLTSNPFLRLLPDVPVNGRDLNPLLQDPGFLLHPPMLYMGYVGFAVTFALAIAALLCQQLNQTWAKVSRPFTLLAWTFLTAGITLGSWWAYRVLGWGGWWFWDPVENASFMPWLVGTALLHSLLVTEKRGQFRAWTVLLAISTFALSLLGTFLVRSGVLTSVHAFAVDPERGVFMLLYLAVVVGTGLLIYLWKMPEKNSGGSFDLAARESMLLFNNVILSVAMLTVLLGTLYPLLIDALGLGKLSVGAPYFNSVFIPLMLPMLLLIGVAPNSRWHKMSFAPLLRDLWRYWVLAIVLGVFLPWWLFDRVSFYAVLGVAFAAWIIMTLLRHVFIEKKRRSLAMILAHLGVAVCVVGISLTSNYSVQDDLRMRVGQAETIGPYQVTLQTIKSVQGPNYQGIAAEFTAQREQATPMTLTSYKKNYTLQNFPMTDAAIKPGFFSDLYLAVSEQINEHSWAVRLYYKPFIRWIWAGGVLILVGGLLAFIQSVRRVR